MFGDVNCILGIVEKGGLGVFPQEKNCYVAVKLSMLGHTFGDGSPVLGHYEVCKNGPGV